MASIIKDLHIQPRLLISIGSALCMRTVEQLDDIIGTPFHGMP